VLFPPPNPPSSPNRVVITGAGIVTGLGIGWRDNAEGFRTGRTAFRPVTLFDVSRQRTRIAAEVDLPVALPARNLPAHQLARQDRSTKILLLAAAEAWTQAGWLPGENLPVILGTTGGGMRLGEEYLRQAVQLPSTRRHQTTRVIHYQAQQQALTIYEALGSCGPVTIISNACASGANAIGHAWEMVRSGRANRVFAGGYDGLCQLTFAGFDSLQALSSKPCRPFEAKRDGLSLGEGAGILALESLTEATRRGAEVLGEIIGYATVTDLHHLTQPHPQGDAAFATMSGACAAAGLSPEQVDYINAHGTATPQNDRTEAAAINRWAGKRAASLLVSSTKASIGHLLGAAGAVEAVVCVMTIREQWLPPERAVETPDPECQFRLVREPVEAPVNCVLSNSFGFGGANASLIFRRWL